MHKLFKAIYFAAMVAETAIRAPYNTRRRNLPKQERRITPAEQGLLGALFFAMFVLPLVYSVSRRLDFANYRLSPSAGKLSGALGAVFMAAAVWVFWRSHRDLGANWSPTLEITEQHTLTTTGVYGKIRHPMYASQALWGVGQALLLQNWVAGFGALPAYVAMYLIRVPREEQMMLEHFGDEYREYSARTGGILPRFGA
ncbi:MAG TPA: protein-S-isoprenylcysteine O-methyltransferase [Chloroflexia bacterium]|nr:protein-S-isoprenylcysteine O-methyltransferase [Chloroflexia bacterium]